MERNDVREKRGWGEISERVIKGICLCLLSLLIIIPCDGIFSYETFAAAESLIISEDEYYGKNALRNLENAENLIFAYEQIAKGAAQSLDSITMYDSLHSVTKDEMKIVFTAYINDYPQNFWHDHSYRYTYSSSSNMIYELMISYNMSGEELDKAKADFDNAVKEVTTGITSDMCEYDREKLVHDRLAQRISYVSDAANAHNAYGGMVGREAVCDGYSRAFQCALYNVGIQCVTVTGNAVSSTGDGAHAWSLVRVEGDYYYTDLTWDDQTSIYYAYFNLPFSEMSEDHTLENVVYDLPECESTEWNYFTINESRIDTYTVDNIAAVLNKNLVAEVYLTGDNSGFVSWLKQNMSSIARKCGVFGGFSYSYSHMGREYVIKLDAERQTIPVTKVAFDKTEYTFDKIGATCKMTATVSPSNATNTKVTYSSSDTSVVSVNKYTGMITAKGEGFAYITATSEDGNIAGTCKVIVKEAKELEAVLKIDGSVNDITGKVGDTIELSAEASGGTGNYTYKYVVHNLDTNTWFTLKDYGSSSVYTSKLSSAGNKEFVVSVKDGSGKIVATNRVKVTAVSGVLTGSLKVNGLTGSINVGVGSSVRLEAVASGGAGNYTYKYVVHNLDTNTWFTLKDYGSSASYTSKISSAGNKEFIVSVRDGSGKTVATNKVKVIAAAGPLAASLNINGSSENITANVGSSIRLIVSASGGAGNYTYKYVVHNLDTNTWFTLKDYGSSASYTSKISSAGNKEFVVSVKDGSGKTVATNKIKVVGVS